MSEQELLERSRRSSRRSEKDRAVTANPAAPTIFYMVIIFLIAAVTLGIAIWTIKRVNDTHYTCYLVEDLVKELDCSGNTTVLCNGTGTLAADPACDDSNVCTLDYSDGLGSCVNRPVPLETATCDDVCRAGGADNGACVNGQCVSTNACLGDCTVEGDCPAIDFTNDGACDRDCIDGACQWHCGLTTETPYQRSLSSSQVNDNQIINDAWSLTSCRQFLNMTDTLTANVVDSGCLHIDSQLYPLVPLKRNVIEDWRITCVYHFACATPSPGTF